MIDDGKLDTMLSAPLDDVADGGFSLRIAHTIERRQGWRERLTWGLPVAAVMVAAPFLPVQHFGETIARLGPAIGGSAALSLALAALVLTISFDQRYREWSSSAL